MAGGAQMSLPELKALYQEMKARQDHSLWPPPVSKPEPIFPGGLKISVPRDLFPADFQPSSLNANERLLSSLHYCCAVVDRYARNGQIYAPQLDQAGRRLEAAVVPFSITGGLADQRGSGGYHFADLSSDELQELFLSDPRVGRELLRRVAWNIRLGLPISNEARELACSVISGERDLPTVSDRYREDLRHRDTLLVALAERLRSEAGYSASVSVAKFQRSKLPPICGCTIAAAALLAYSVHMPSDLGRKIVAEGKSHLATVPNMGELLRPYDFRAAIRAGVTIASSTVEGRVYAALERLHRPVTVGR